MRAYGRAYFIYLFIYSGLEFTLTFLTHMRFHYDRFVDNFDDYRNDSIAD